MLFCCQQSMVTQAQFFAVMGYLPEGFGAAPFGKSQPPSAMLPVHRVSVNAAALCNGLSQLNGLGPCYLCQGEGQSRVYEEKKAFSSGAF
jgi:hypothetical protein